MMKKFFLVALIAFVALATSGCAGTISSHRFSMFPTVYVEVVNNCFASTVHVKSPGGGEVAIRYGSSTTVILERHLGNESQMVLTARGIGDDGTYLGSSARPFSTGYRGGRQDYWLIQSLQGGARSCNPPNPRRP